MPVNIESRPVWKPMHMQPVFGGQGADGLRHSTKIYRSRVVGGEVSEDLFALGLCLPSGTAMTEQDLERIVTAILNCRK